MAANTNSSSSNKKPNVLEKINPMMWKQARTVKKAAASVEELVDHLTQNAPFLSETPSITNIAVLHRNEISTGKLLGEGSFCQVYEVTRLHLQDSDEGLLSKEEIASRKQLQQELRNEHDARRDLLYVIKQPKRDLLRKSLDFAKAIADLVVEAKYLSRLDHPNILTVRGLPIGGTHSFESGRFDSYFMIMDRLTDSLDQRIKKWQGEGPADPAMIPRKTNYSLQIANALLYLHKRRIIFRDLKPENVGFQGEHTVKLFDFGLVREVPQGFDDEVYTMSGSGSQWYMAVEIFLTGKYNLKADVFSWAITTYEMLTETKAFEKLHKLQHLSMVCVQGKRPRLSHYNFPPGLNSIIRAAWGQTVSKRPNMQQVVHRLEKLLPELGDEAACSWPTVEPDSLELAGSLHKKHERLAGTNVDDEETSLEDLLLHSDGVIDDELRQEVKRGHIGKAGNSNGDLDDMEFSFSSVMYEDH